MPRPKDIKLTYQFSLMEMAWVLNEAIAAAATEAHSDAHKTLSAARTLVAESLTVEAAYERERGLQPDAKDAAAADREVTRRVTVIHRTIAARAELGRSTPSGRAASNLLKHAFRGTLFDHVHAPYHKRHVLTDQLVATLRHPDHLATVRNLGLASLVDQLEEANKVFAATISPEMGVTKEMLLNAREAGEDAFVIGIYKIATMFNPRDAGQSHVRDVILFPLTAMNRKLAARYRTGPRTSSEEATAETTEAAAAAEAAEAIEAANAQQAPAEAPDDTTVVDVPFHVHDEPSPQDTTHNAPDVHTSSDVGMSAAK